MFRQGTREWDLLHVGRLTTSKAAACLGLFEPKTAKTLKIPRSMVGYHRAANARDHLLLRIMTKRNTEGNEGSRSYPSLRELSDLLVNEVSTQTKRRRWRKAYRKRLKRVRETYWVPWKNDHGREDEDARTRWVRRYDRSARLKSPESAHRKMTLSSVRQRWGNVHECTAILVALNVFVSRDETTRVREVGMFPGEHVLEKDATKQTVRATREQIELLRNAREEGLLVGASPDGLIEHRDEDGRRVLEVLEVKNHAPFGLEYFGRSRRSRWIIRDRPPDTNVPIMYMPQIQLHMLCADTSTAVLVRLTATCGAM